MHLSVSPYRVKHGFHTTLCVDYMHLAVIPYRAEHGFHTTLWVDSMHLAGFHTVQSTGSIQRYAHFSHLEKELSERLSGVITVSPAVLGARALYEELLKTGEINEENSGDGRLRYL